MVNLLNAFADFVFPRTSIISGENIDDANSNQYISDDEINSIPRVTPEDLDELKIKVLSDHCFSVFAFRDGDDFSKIIYQLKYGGMKRLGTFLGRLIGNELRNNFEPIPEFKLLIPVPLFKTKVRERGYNQSDHICKGMNEILNIEFKSDLILRTRHTITQTKLTREERLLNMKNAFELNEKFRDKIEGKKIIIVDDVVTTGATLNEMINVLKENNCGEILACTLAMAR
ncbi:MAG: phosphoribosyltransferase family protein [Ignavibacteria bacterium]